MKIKCYTASTAKEALEMVRRELGENALILSTKERFGRVEVVAATEFDFDTLKEEEPRKAIDIVEQIKESSSPPGSYPPSSPSLSSIYQHLHGSQGGEPPPPQEEKPASQVPQVAPPGMPVASEQSPVPSHVMAEIMEIKEVLLRLLQDRKEQETIRGLSNEIKEIKELLKKQTQQTESSTGDLQVGESLRPIYERLKKQELSGELLKNVMITLSLHPDAVDPYLIAEEVLSKEILTVDIFGQKPSKVLMLLGPTGVGKTTTIAKLAAMGTISGLKMGIVNIDTYRIGATEQLKTYARIMGLPFKVAHSPESFVQCCDSLSYLDLILVDTAGRSPTDDLRIEDMRGFLDSSVPITSLVVLGIPTRTEDMLMAVEKFKDFKVVGFIFTKLDESSVYGPMITVCKKAAKPVAYITTGQRVPEDIELALPGRIARLILGTESILTR